MDRSQHDKLSYDSQLIEAGLRTLDKLVEETQSDLVRSLRDTCTELNQDAQRRRVEVTMMANDADNMYFGDPDWASGEHEPPG